MPSELLTGDEVAELLRVSRRTVTRMASSGKLAEVKLTERTIRYRREDVEALLASGDAA